MLFALASPPFERVLTLVVFLGFLSCTKTSLTPLPSSPMRLVAFEVKATKRPESDICGPELKPFASAPLVLLLERVVFPD